MFLFTLVLEPGTSASSLVTETITATFSSFKRLDGIGSRSHDLGANFKMPSLTG